MKKANSKQIAKFKAMRDKLFKYVVERWYKDGVEELEMSLFIGADLDPTRSIKDLNTKEIQGLLDNTDATLKQYGIIYEKDEQIKIDE